MKITFSFDTDSEHYQSDEYERMLKADDMCDCLWDIAQQVKGWCNHPERYEKLTEDSLSEFFWKTMDEHGINLERLWP